MFETFNESGMTFKLEKNNLFRIENSVTYKKLRGDFKIAEFLLYRPENNNLVVLEAKTSAPNPQPGLVENEHEIETRKKIFNDYIKQICDKLINALTLGVNIYLGRYEDNEFPFDMKSMPFSDLEIILILVIKNHKISWLPNIQECLQQKLRSTTKAWNCKVIVLNEAMAKTNHLIQ